MLSKAPSRIVVFAPNWLGDAVMCTPALRALHRLYPSASIVVAARPAICELLAGLPYVEACAAFPKRGGRSAINMIRRQYGKPDLAVVLPHSFRAAWAARMLGARYRLGYDRNGRRLLFTHAMDAHRDEGRIAPVYMAKEYLELVAAIGAEDDNAGLELHADPEIVEAFSERVEGDGPLVGFAPGAAFGPSKRWIPERYAEVADALREQRGARCVLLTGPGEEDTRAAVQASAKVPLLLPGDKPTIGLLKAAISRCDLLIGNDSGPRHVAVAFQVPVVCIMGPTSPVYSEGPYEKGVVLRIDVDCGPCQKPICHTDHRCMTGISTKWVTESALELLDTSQSATGNCAQVR
jgi:heptosyltransferase II